MLSSLIKGMLIGVMAGIIAGVALNAYSDYKQVLYPVGGGFPTYSCVPAASLPSTAAVGQLACVSDWNGTNGQCVDENGGNYYTTAIAGTGNVWWCP